MKLRLKQLLSICIIPLSALTLSCGGSSGGDQPAPKLPGAPSGILHETSQTSAKVTWDKALDADSYELILNTETAKVTKELSYTFSELEPNTPYGLKIRSVKEDKYFSEWVTADFSTDEIEYSTEWIGSWKGSNITAVANAGVLPLPIGSLLPPEGLDVPVVVLLTKDPVTANQVVASITGLEEYLPGEEIVKFNAVPISVSSSGLSGSMPIDYSIPSFIENPIKFVDIPGFTDALQANPLLAILIKAFPDAALESATVKMTSISTSGDFTDLQKQKADLKFIANGKLTLATNTDAAIDTILNEMVGDLSITISMSSDKQP